MILLTIRSERDNLLKAQETVRNVSMRFRYASQTFSLMFYWAKRPVIPFIPLMLHCQHSKWIKTQPTLNTSYYVYIHKIPKYEHITIYHLSLSNCYCSKRSAYLFQPITCTHCLLSLNNQLQIELNIEISTHFLLRHLYLHERR